MGAFAAPGTPCTDPVTSGAFGLVNSTMFVGPDVWSTVGANPTDELCVYIEQQGLSGIKLYGVDLFFSVGASN